MKYIDSERLKAKLDEHYRKYQSKYMETRTPYTQGLIDALDLAEQVIDSLQKEQTPLPSELDEAAEKKYPVYWKNYPKDGIARSELSYYRNKQCREAFIAGAEWQKSQMLKDAVEGRVFMSFAPGHNQMVMADVDLPTNTKVRIVVLKEEEDEKMLQSIIKDFRAGKVSTIGQEQWLKSLRPSWKPSENQMSMLLAVVNDPNNAGSASCHLSLESLYNDLKKL